MRVRLPPHPSPYTLHPTPFTRHPSPYTSPCILHPTPYILHPTPLGGRVVLSLSLFLALSLTLSDATPPGRFRVSNPVPADGAIEVTYNLNPNNWG